MLRALGVMLYGNRSWPHTCKYAGNGYSAILFSYLLLFILFISFALVHFVIILNSSARAEVAYHVEVLGTRLCDGEQAQLKYHMTLVYVVACTPAKTSVVPTANFVAQCTCVANDTGLQQSEVSSLRDTCFLKCMLCPNTAGTLRLHFAKTLQKPVYQQEKQRASDMCLLLSIILLCGKDDDAIERWGWRGGSCTS